MADPDYSTYIPRTGAIINPADHVYDLWELIDSTNPANLMWKVTVTGITFNVLTFTEAWPDLPARKADSLIICSSTDHTVPYLANIQPPVMPLRIDALGRLATLPGIDLTGAPVDKGFEFFVDGLVVAPGDIRATPMMAHTGTNIHIIRSDAAYNQLVVDYSNKYNFTVRNVIMASSGTVYSFVIPMGTTAFRMRLHNPQEAWVFGDEVTLANFEAIPAGGFIEEDDLMQGQFTLYFAANSDDQVMSITYWDH